MLGPQITEGVVVKCGRNDGVMEERVAERVEGHGRRLTEAISCG